MNHFLLLENWLIVKDDKVINNFSISRRYDPFWLLSMKKMIWRVTRDNTFELLSQLEEQDLFIYKNSLGSQVSILKSKV